MLQKASKHDLISIFLPQKKEETPPLLTPPRHFVSRVMASLLFRLSTQRILDPTLDYSITILTISLCNCLFVIFHLRGNVLVDFCAFSLSACDF